MLPMRRLILAAIAAVLMSATPAVAGPEKPVEIRNECGNKVIYVMGQPINKVDNVWCGPPTE